MHEGTTGDTPSSGPGTPVTVIVPTFREAENLPALLERVTEVRTTRGLDLDLLIVDDDSDDGSVEAVERFGAPWVQILVRHGRRGLATAVVDGIARARGDIIVVMDADLSHPPEAIPELLAALEDADIVIGSRYVAGGSTDDDWGAWRLFKSRIATRLARPLMSVNDPMAGFFAIRRRDVVGDLRPVGYKILLELIVRCRLERVTEVPIHFRDRFRGSSKLTTREELLFLEHLRRLYVFELASLLTRERKTATRGSRSRGSAR
jgi:dolichol-phosphate mannosyltransferase